MIYQNESDLLSYISKKNKYFENQKYNFSAFDPTTSTLIIYNPLQKTLSLINCEFEIQKQKSKIRLLSIPKSEKNTDSGRKIKILRSGRSFLPVNEESFLNGIEDEDDLKLSLSSKRLEMNKCLKGFLNLETKKNRLLRTCIFDILTNNLYGKYDNFEQFFEIDEKITCSKLCLMNKNNVLYVVGSNKGNIYLFPFETNEKTEKYCIYFYKDNNNGGKIENIDMHKNCLFVKQDKNILVTFQLFIDTEEETSQYIFKSIQKLEKFKMKTESPLISFHKIEIIKWTEDLIDSVYANLIFTLFIILI